MDWDPILRNEGMVRVRPWLPPNCLEALILGKMGGVGEILRKGGMVRVRPWLHCLQTLIWVEWGPILRNEGRVRVPPWLPPNCLETLILGKMGGVGEILRKGGMVRIRPWHPPNCLEALIL